VSNPCDGCLPLPGAGPLRARGRHLTYLHYSLSPGVWITFVRHSPNWQVVQYIHSPSQKSSGQNIERVSESVKTPSPDLLPNPEFYSHLASWHPCYPLSTLSTSDLPPPQH
jgi:hypothetical protein